MINPLDSALFVSGSGKGRAAERCQAHTAANASCPMAVSQSARTFQRNRPLSALPRRRAHLQRLNIAEGSVEERRYFLILTKDLGYGDTQALSAALEEVSRLLGAYTAAILASGS